MSEDQLEKGAVPNQDSGDEVKKDFKGLVGSVRKFLSELLEIRTNTDATATKESIIADITFKGHTSWILICSIFIASVGLNANSTAVVIGAMLISPLMGPILGMGMSLAINDIDTLRRSLKNFTVMVVLSVVTAFLFFYLFPLRDESSELLARTKPDIRDVLIAFFGGLALVIARAKKGTIASVIFGVAIATALMPPLCTVGFGLAIGKPLYAAGAMYLFTINTIFIGLATFLVIKFLRFPMVRYANSQRRRMIARLASITGILVMIPAGFTFYNVFQESLFRKQAQQFLDETIEVYQFNGAGRYVDNLTKIEYVDDGSSLIEVVCMGDELIPENVVNTWRTQKNQYSRLKNAELHVIQGGRDDSEEKFNFVSELYERNKADLLNKDEQIRLLEEEVAILTKNMGKQVPFKDVSAEARANYGNIERLGFSYQIQTDFKKLDTVPVFEVKWKQGIQNAQKEADIKKMQTWLKIRLRDSTIVVKEVE
ncbi:MULTISPECIES: DUF389 domain-containing protein [Flagellimonas]|uniref:DUF389 domain-containing protein n=1 Tax=Flagellimonas hadalis TaxID=2597517 RepID=A0A5N5J125_9FLAO|nr:DUF389 domain-containing protein [Allomuricauda hadalis]KAB5485517.1 DUF389 domain-containing protein [Allomuricauda hadalis]RUA11962.1 MAG: hypothetical protein DSY83_15780 [Flavobacteriia bacterium]